jgi:endonuclease YncB( thermonuclease family)
MQAKTHKGVHSHIVKGNFDQLLVKEGMCWWYRKYAAGNAALEELETDAREKRIGLWAEAQPIPPWEWRKAKRTPTR